MSLAAGFLGDARSRLLPASIPLRFFGAAVAFHVLAWLALLAAGGAAPGFAGGLGAPLAALHLLTLGVLAMAAIGASLQLLPVATRQPVASPRVAAALWWLYTGGVAALTLAMAGGDTLLLAAGGASLALALGTYAVMLARSLRAARGMPVVAVHGWGAWAGLVVALASALALVAAYAGHGVLDRRAALGLHVAFAAYGFMGLLVLGFSYVLVPMFAIADAPATRPALGSAAAAIAALAVSAPAAFGVAPAVLWPLAVVLGAAALAVHVVLMRRTLRSGLRPRLGRSFVLVRVGWGLLAFSLLAAFALALNADMPRLPVLFGVLLVGGLLSVLTGMLSRIVPFLASMHAAPGRRPPLPSALTADRPLAVHFACHLAALALLVSGVAADSAWLVRAAGLVGAAGAIAFAAFFAIVWRRIRP